MFESLLLLFLKNVHVKLKMEKMDEVIQVLVMKMRFITTLKL